MQASKQAAFHAEMAKEQDMYAYVKQESIPRSRYRAALLGLAAACLLFWQLVMHASSSTYMNTCHSGTDFDVESAFLQIPRAANIRAALKRYTAIPHLAGDRADLLSAERNIEEWSALLGLPNVENATQQIVDAGTHASRDLMEGKHEAKARVWADTYSVWLDEPQHASLALFDGEEPVWEAKLAEDVLEDDPYSAHGVPPFHGFAASGNVRGELVFVGAGRKSDFDMLAEHGIDVRGKIVLLRYGHVFRGLKVRAAQEAGAAGVLIYSDPLEDGKVTEANGYEPYPQGPARHPSSIERGSVTALSLYPGDPSTPGWPSYRNTTRLSLEEADVMPRIPSLPISYRNAQSLLQKLEGRGKRAAEIHDQMPGALPNLTYWTGPSTECVHLDTKSELHTRDIWNVYAVIPGELDDERIVLGNHRDAWTFGAADPSSGTAIFHDIVRGFGALLAKGWRPKRTIVLASWDGEESGLMGSTEFGEDFVAHIRDKVAMYVNVDMAVSGSKLSARASPSLQALTQGAVRDTYATPLEEIRPLGSGSDFTVFVQRHGIASADIGFKRTSEDPVYHYHSNYDSFTWMETFGDPGFTRHEVMAKTVGLMALRAAQPAFLPLDLVAFGDALQEYYTKLTEIAAKSDVALPDLQDIELGIDEVRRAAATFAEYRTSVAHALETVHAKALPTTLRAVQEVNTKLKQFERIFLSEHGLEYRPWYRNLVVAPGRWLGYGATTFPGVTESITLDGGNGTAYEVKRLIAALYGAAHWLKS
ncbi:glutamate carboxypeptidase II [Malassezia vespertilionis]|uniref:Uncharacterized protein n=1 Tax=Malassezia vespertilionis TaxID=2020962 RepID=A0A2N1JA28_9BASI|nr:glutamate carboxypeptidase II [Malassezia vespertilionis]PKI83410.1 hypothetical protein MVES_002695 [Malassezia vespertilionis]WFD07483.1 glutamate carboxypeptidase II [Malassezia vespertilionis]